MILAVSSDERTPLTDAVVAMLRERGHEPILLGPLADQPLTWPLAAEALAVAVVEGRAAGGVLFCYTGTGASIAANKVPGIRAALCVDAATARGARWWNDANVLVLSLRLTSVDVAREILDAWLTEQPRPEEAACLAELAAMERRWGGARSRGSGSDHA